jgi:hypothetical protein
VRSRLYQWRDHLSPPHLPNQGRLLYFKAPCPTRNPLSRLDHQELIWLTEFEGCMPEAEKNLVSQAFEEGFISGVGRGEAGSAAIP